MSVAIQTEVWNHAPVTGNDLILLLRLADAAGESHRMCWESVATLEKRCRVSESTVYRSLRKLYDLNIIEDVEDADAPRESRLYKSVVRRIRPVEDWLSKAPESGQTDPCQIDTPVTGDTPVTADTPVTRDREPQSLATSSNTSSDLRPQKPLTSRRRSVRKRQTEPEPEDGLAAAARVLDGDDEPEPARESPAVVSTELEGVEPPPRRTRQRSLSPTQSLARSFSVESRRRGHGRANEGALSRRFRDWLEDGLAYRDIEALIARYWAEFNRGGHREGATPWKEFLNLRSKLEAAAKRDAQQAEDAERGHDAAYWTQVGDEPDTRDADYWSRIDS